MVGDAELSVHQVLHHHHLTGQYMVMVLDQCLIQVQLPQMKEEDLVVDDK